MYESSNILPPYQCLLPSLLVLIIVILVSVNVTVVLICVALMTVDKSIFSSSYWLVGYLLWRDVYSIFLSIFKWIICPLLLDCNIVCIVDISLTKFMVCTYFFSLFWWCLLKYKVLNSWILLFLSLMYLIYLRNHFITQEHKNLVLSFLLRVVALTWVSIIHF